ncbi:hypothetical protein DZF79_04400 [Vibrio parahaemolyticus]|nr:hypothetical protein [Vibrio parahaemolyticus]
MKNLITFSHLLLATMILVVSNLALALLWDHPLSFYFAMKPFVSLNMSLCLLLLSPRLTPALMMLPVVYSMRWVIGSLFAAYQPNDTGIFVSGEYLQFLIIEIIIFTISFKLLHTLQRKYDPFRKVTKDNLWLQVQVNRKTQTR